MTGLGFGEIFGALLIGIMVDKFGSKKTVMLNLLLLKCSVITTLIVLNVDASIPLTVLMCFFWGTHDGCLTSHSSEMLGFQFETKMEPFSIFNLAKSLFVFAFSMI